MSSGDTAFTSVHRAPNTFTARMEPGMAFASGAWNVEVVVVTRHPDIQVPPPDTVAEATPEAEAGA